MPNIEAAKKHVRVTAKRTARNKATSSALKTALKKANVALADNAQNKNEIINDAIKKIDKAAAKGIIHKNNAARKKSALSLKLNQS